MQLVAPRQPELETQEGEGELPKQAIIVDIDGTLSHLNGRDPYNYGEVMYDKLNPIVDRLIRKYKRDGYYILLMTGRPTSCTEDTMKWLDMNHVPYDLLAMRTTGDKSLASDLKRQLYESHIKGKYDVEFVLEDLKPVVKMWRSIGLVCFQVA